MGVNSQNTSNSLSSLEKEQSCWHGSSFHTRRCYVASGTSNSERAYGLRPARLLGPWDSPGKNTAVGCPALFQGTFPTQRSNLCLLHPLCVLGSPEKSKFLDFVSGKDFFRYNIKTQETKIESGLQESESFCTAKETNEIKGQPMQWESIFANHISKRVNIQNINDIYITQ